MKEWFQLVEELSPSIVKIETPDGHGTGFLFAYNENRAVTATATAHHVVEHANKWLQPIRLHNAASKETVVLKEGQRVIWANKDRRIDSAAILVPTDSVASLKFPEKPIGFIPTGKHLKVANEVGWFGFPSIGPDTLCFFAGRISAWQRTGSEYLIDGVAINGVSGGPVFHRRGESAIIVGAITAYMPNRLTAATLPGLSIAQDVSHFEEVLNEIKSWDDAERKKKEEEAKPEEPIPADPAP
jgi:hypothetical protein